MNFNRFGLVFVLVFSSFVAAQEDTPSLVLPYADKISSHSTVGGDSIDIHEAIEQLAYAQQGLQEIREVLKDEKLAALYEEVVLRKKAQLDYLCENSGTPHYVLSKQRVKIKSPVTPKETRRKKNKYVIIGAKKKQSSE